MSLSVCICSLRTIVSLSLLVLFVSSDIDWIQSIPKLPIPLMQACIATTANNTIYIFGGYTDNLIPSKKIYLFNPSTNIIHTLNISTPTNQFICNHNAVYSNITNKIYIIGIYTDNSDDWDHTTRNYEFDPSTHEFTSISNAGYVLRQSCIAIYNTSIFVYGGIAGVVYYFVSSLFIYDILSKEWTQKASSNDIIWDGACYAFGDSLYTFGGWTPPPAGGIIKDILRYDLETNAWYTINTLTYDKWEMRAVRYNAMDDTVLIIGGYGEMPEHSFKIEAYNYENNTVISDIGKLEYDQGGSLMVVSYLDNIVLLGGNSYWWPREVPPNEFYDDIYISYTPTQLPIHVPTETLESTETTETLKSTETIYTKNTVITVYIVMSDTTFEISKIAMIVGSTSLGIICVLVCCYIFYKERNSRNVKQETHPQTTNYNKLELAKQRVPGTYCDLGTDEELELKDNQEETDPIDIDVDHINMDKHEESKEGMARVQSLVRDNVHDDVLNEALNTSMNEGESNIQMHINVTSK